MYDNFDGPGFDFDHNGTDDYIDYQMSSGGGGDTSGSSGGEGCGCFFWIIIVVMFLYVLGSCS